MGLVLRQVRACDGSCCRESPRFPNARGDDCIYHLAPAGKERGGCKLMIDPSLVPLAGVKSSPYPERDAKDVYRETCVEWPQKNSLKEIGDTGDCCWQWVKA